MPANSQDTACFSSEQPCATPPAMEPALPGRFGPFGGRFVAETLMPALDELEPAYREARADPVFEAERLRLLKRLRRPRDPALLRPAPLRGGRSARLAQARGPLPHGRAQGQQHDRSGAARQAHGQAARDRGDRRGAARRGHRDGVRAVRPACEVFMGAEDVKRQAPNVLRMGLLGAKVHAVSSRLAHAQGRDERGHARLGHQRADHLLLRGQRGGSASLSRHRARLSGRDRPTRRARSSWRPSGKLPDAVVACVGGGSNAIGMFNAVPRRQGRALDRRRGRRRRHRQRQARGHAHGRAGSACCTA